MSDQFETNGTTLSTRDESNGPSSAENETNRTTVKDEMTMCTGDETAVDEESAMSKSVKVAVDESTQDKPNHGLMQSCHMNNIHCHDMSVPIALHP